MTIIRLIHFGICAAFGYSGFVAFIVLANYFSASLALLSGIGDSISFLINFLKRKGRLENYYTRENLRTFCRYGILTGTIGLLSLGYNLTIQIINKQPIYPVSTSCVISIVWSIISMRSGITLMYYAIKYQYTDNVRLLEHPEENNVSNDEGVEPESGNSSTVIT